MSKSRIEGHDESIGKGDHAGMPKEVYMGMYPKTRLPMNEGIDDAMTEIDDVVSRGEGKRSKYKSNQH